MSLVEQYASERRARLERLGAIPTKPFASKLTEAAIIKKPVVEIFVPPVEYFYPSFWCWDLVSSQNRIPPTIKSIQVAVAQTFGVPVIEINSARRNKAILLPRAISMYLSKRLTTLSLPAIGRHFGGRDHTTVLHSVNKIEADREMNTELNNLILQLESRFA